MTKTRLEAYAKMFPDFEFLGWYSTSDINLPSNEDKIVHKKFQAYNENALYMILNTKIDLKKDPSKKNMPVFIYESVFASAGNAASMSFNKVNYKTETLEAERISVD